MKDIIQFIDVLSNLDKEKITKQYHMIHLLETFDNSGWYEIYGEDKTVREGKDNILILDCTKDDSYVRSYYLGPYTKEIKEKLYEMSSIGHFYGYDEYGEPIFERGASIQGSVYKNVWAYCNREDYPCYIPELHDTVYTFKDFLLLDEIEAICDEIFEGVDWQSPEILYEEIYDNEYFDILRKENIQEKEKMKGKNRHDERLH